MNTLTADELGRVQASLFRNFPTAARNQIVAVGFGPALKRGKPSPDRPFAACVFVRKKKRPSQVPEAEMIRETMPIRVRRGKRFVTIPVPTDIRELPRLKPSARFVENHDEEWLGSAGVIISWRFQKMERLWGIVTAGHISNFGDGKVLLVRRKQKTGVSMAAVVIARTSVAELVDACVLRVEAQSLMDFGLIASMGAPARGDYWSSADLIEHLKATQRGRSLWPFSPLNTFDTGLFFVDSGPMVEELGNLRNVFFANEDGIVTDPFRPGTSGSLWMVDDLPAGIQVAYDPDVPTSGLSQFLDVQLDWARRRIEQLNPDLTLAEFDFVKSF